MRVEVQAQVGARAGPHAVGDLLDAEVAALEQFTREVALATDDPLRQRVAADVGLGRGKR